MKILMYIPKVLIITSIAMVIMVMGGISLITPTQAQSVTVTIDISPTSINEEESITITWSSTGALSCSGTNFSTNGDTSGSVNVYHDTAGEYNYTVTCTSSSPACLWQQTFTSQEDVWPAGNCPSLSAACSPKGDTCHTRTGSFGNYTVTGYSCQGSCQTASDSESITVNPPPTASVTLTSTATTSGSGDEVLLSWTSEAVYSCTSNEFGTGGATSSSATVYPTQTTTYSITCEGDPVGQSSYEGTWEHIGSDATDYWCPRDYGPWPQCPGGFYEGGPCTGPAVCGVDSGQCTVYTEVYNCEGSGSIQYDTGTDSVTITVLEEPELGAGTPSLNSGALEVGNTITFKSLITNSGNADALGTFDVRFQIDVGDNGTYDTNLDSLNEIAGLAEGASQNGISESWIGQEGTHAVRACADLPGDDVAEQNENNNCGAEYIFTVKYQCNDGLDNDGDGDIDINDPGCTSTTDTNESDNPECSDTIDNDGDGLIDYPDDPGCNNVFDAKEGSTPSINFILFEADPSLIRSGDTTDLSWQVSSAKVGSCVISGTNGDNFGLTGLSGTKTTGQIFGITTFVLTCEDLEGTNQSISTTVRVVPKFNEI